MQRNPVSHISNAMVTAMENSVKSANGSFHTSSSGKPWGHDPNVFKVAMSMLPDDGVASQGDVDFNAGTNFGEVDESAFCILVINGLDGPLKQTDYYRGSGDLESFPYYDEMLYRKGELGRKVTYEKQVPGRQVVMTNRRYGIPKAKQTPDVETYGMGIWTFQRRGGLYGVDCAIALTADDPDFNSTIAISGGVSLSGTPGLGFAKDLTATGQTLQAFHNATGEKETGTGLNGTGSQKSVSGSKTVTVDYGVHMANLTQYNEFRAPPMMATKLWTIAVFITKTVT